MPNTVLIVDDDPETHVLLRTMLKGTNWITESTLGGEEALEKLKERPFDIVLTDILMTEMDGITLLGRIQAIRPGAKMLVMTAFNRPSHVVGSLRGQAAGYLAKPFSKAKLLEALTDALDSHMQPDDIEVVSDSAELDLREGALQTRNG